MPAQLHDSPSPAKDTPSVHAGLSRCKTFPIIDHSSAAIAEPLGVGDLAVDATLSLDIRKRPPPPLPAEHVSVLSTSISSPPLAKRSTDPRPPHVPIAGDGPPSHRRPRLSRTYTLADTSFHDPDKGTSDRDPPHIHFERPVPSLLPPHDMTSAQIPPDRPSTPNDEFLRVLRLVNEQVRRPAEWHGNLKPGAYRKHSSDNVVRDSEMHDIYPDGRGETSGKGTSSISAVISRDHNSRSRKGSQRLGLFKENPQAVEERERERHQREEEAREKERRREEKRRAKDTEEKAKEASSKGNRNVADVPLLSFPSAETIGKDVSGGAVSDSISVTQTKDDRKSPPSSDNSPFEAVLRDTLPPKTSVSVSALSDSVPASVCRIESPQVIASEPDSSNQTPHSDLVESRHDGIGFSRHANATKSFPVQARAGEAEWKAREASDASSRKNNPVVSHGDSSDPNDDDEDEDEEDEIKSALYFPHKTPSIPVDVESTQSFQEQVDSENVAQAAERAGSAEPDRPRPGDEGELDERSQFDLTIKKGEDEIQVYHGEQRQPPPDEAALASGYQSSVASEYSDLSDYDESSTDDIERSVVEESDVESTPKAVRKNLDGELRGHDINRKGHSIKPADVPLGAVELKPYKHQVGGHTALFRFSRKAVCKSLSNRENEFYETVEKRHPHLLKFLPRYAAFR